MSANPGEVAFVQDDRGAGRTATRVVVDGQEAAVVVDHHVVDRLLLPEIERLSAQAQPGRRTFLFLVAPPGAGKSTLAAILKARAGHVDFDVVGMDGFHHPHAYLESHYVERDGTRVPLSSIKGAPETFDVAGLARQLEAARTRALPWPAYDRVVHDVVPGTHPVDAGVVLVEGNWLLLGEPAWTGLSDFSAYNVFVEAQPELLRDRLVHRKVRGGWALDEAVDFYERSDRLNVERVLARTDRSKVDLLLHLDTDGTIDRRGTS